jgi:elongation factor 1-beta
VNLQNSSAQTAVKSKLNATANAANSADYSDAQNVGSKGHKVGIVMGAILVVYKIFPEDIVPDFEPLKEKVKAILPQSSSVEGWGEEPVAFGLKALLVQIRFPEDKMGIVEEFETALAKIPGVSQAEAFNIRRTSRD